jgi:hypothetical protein
MTTAAIKNRRVCREPASNSVLPFQIKAMTLTETIHVIERVLPAAAALMSGSLVARRADVIWTPESRSGARQAVWLGAGLSVAEEAKWAMRELKRWLPYRR